MKIGETILFSVVTGLAVALILSATVKNEPPNNTREYHHPTPATTHHPPATTHHPVSSIIIEELSD